MTEAAVLVIMAWWKATFRGELDRSEVPVWLDSLADTDPEDAKAVIDGIAAIGGYPPTPQRIAELAEQNRRERLRLFAERPHQLPPRDGYVSFAEFLRDHPDMAERVKALDDKVDPKKHPAGAAVKDALAKMLEVG